jgi:hypothetical protein
VTTPAPSRLTARKRGRYALLGALAALGSVAMYPSTIAPHRASNDPPGRLLWQASFDPGDLSQLGKVDAVPDAPQIVSSQAIGGGHAGAYRVPGGGQRCETVPRMSRFGEGDDLWFAWSTRLSGSFPVNADTWQVITQWKNEGIGSPPIELKVSRGAYLLDGGAGWPGDTENPSPRRGSISLGSARPGVWVHWLVHVKFSADPEKGVVSLWRDGKSEVSHRHLPGGTLYPHAASYLKIGYYRDSTITQDAAVYHDSWKVGTTRRAVS